MNLDEGVSSQTKDANNDNTSDEDSYQCHRKKNDDGSIIDIDTI